MLDRSFRSMAGPLLPRVNARKLAASAVAVALLGAAGCGGAKHVATAKRVTGDGFSFEAPAGWEVTKASRVVQARDGAALLSVTTFRLARPFRPALWETVVVPELDRVAGELAARVHGKLGRGRTRQIAGRNARTYDIARNGAQERIAFVLDGRREYQLFCRGAGDACDRLLETFRLSA